MNNKIKKYFKLIVAISVMIFSLIALPTRATAEENNGSMLEASIEISINAVLDSYLNKPDLDKEIEKVIENTIDTFLNSLDKNALEKQVKDNIKAALQSHLHEIQAAFEKAIEDVTYERSNTLLNAKVKEEIANEMRKAISEYNASCYTYDEDRRNNIFKTRC